MIPGGPLVVGSLRPLVVGYLCVPSNVLAHRHRRPLKEMLLGSGVSDEAKEKLCRSYWYL